MALRHCISDVSLDSESLSREDQKMTKIPEKIRKRLGNEARNWDESISRENPERVEELLESAEVFRARRPPRQPVCLRVEPFDLSILKRIARRKGLPFTQLMSMWLHEKIEQEKATTGI
jgi:predicted DNA binding CopG/RHH family protein